MPFDLPRCELAAQSWLCSDDRQPWRSTAGLERHVVVMHPVEHFWAILQDFDGYPPDVTPVPELLPGTAAFAASAGLVREAGTHRLPPFPYGGLMVVGHNLDNRAGYERRRALGTSHGDLVPGPPMSTWQGLYKLLDNAGVPRHMLFFTNVFVGLKEGKPTGRFSAYPAPEFRSWCAEFLGHQVRTMRPRAVLILGGHACRAIAGLATPVPWPQGPLPPPRVVTARISGFETILVPVHHTSLQKRIVLDAAALRTAWLDDRD